jgi:hypothetical protein
LEGRYGDIDRGAGDSICLSLPGFFLSVPGFFVVDKDNNDSLSYKIVGVNLDPSVDLDKVSTNTLTVTLAPSNGGH